MIKFPHIIITDEMIKYAESQVNKTRVYRTIASKIDTLTGNIRELVFAQYFYGDWKKNRVGKNKGKSDFDNIEIKTSAFPFRNDLNLLVREDYAKKRKPLFYIQIIIDVKSRKADTIKPDTKAYICGWASPEEVDNAPLKDWGSKLSNYGGYKCHYISIRNLHPMSVFFQAYRDRKKKREYNHEFTRIEKY